MVSRDVRGFAPRVPGMVAVLLLAAVVSFPSLVHPQPVAVPPGTTCAECGMAVDPNSKFAVEATTNDNKKLYFCDIGDMLFHFRSVREKMRSVQVRDYATGEWIDGKKAWYVLNRKIPTPMSWNIAAFAAESPAKKWGDPVDFNGAFKLLR